MAKRKRRREAQSKKFEQWPMIIGLVLIIISILSIVPEPMGFIGQLGASFAMFLIGTGYQVLLFFTLLLGFYVLWKREWPDFLDTRFIGLYLTAVGIIVLAHTGYIKENTKCGPMSINSTN